MAKKHKPKTPARASEAARDVELKPKTTARLGINERPIWRLRLIDMDGPWGWAAASERDLRGILAFLQEMERLTWQEIRQHQTGTTRRGPKHKYIPMGAVCAEAQGRIGELRLDDYDGSWFRFRLGNMERLWGVVEEDDGVFYPVWWDPRHEVCPSEGR